jgi:FkbM family methyltransferase
VVPCGAALRRVAVVSATHGRAPIVLERYTVTLAVGLMSPTLLPAINIMIASDGSVAAMRLLKQIIKRTFLYNILKTARAKKQLAQWTPHDQEMLEFYKSFLSPGEVCFDVGANIGNRVKILLKLGALVVAVEPQHECVMVLKAAFGRHPQFKLVAKALGEAEGHAQIMIGDANTISSLSKEWVTAVQKSGRFADHRWDIRQTVPMTTLDKLIAQYGTPAFMKIDVEGFEYEVIKGLTRPVKTLSLEFTPEFIESTFKCFEHLEQLGEIRLNYSVEESMQLALNRWVSRREMVEILSGFKNNHQIFGDVYLRFQSK